MFWVKEAPFPSQQVSTLRVPASSIGDNFLSRCMFAINRDNKSIVSRFRSEKFGLFRAEGWLHPGTRTVEEGSQLL